MQLKLQAFQRLIITCICFCLIGRELTPQNLHKLFSLPHYKCLCVCWGGGVRYSYFKEILLTSSYGALANKHNRYNIIGKQENNMNVSRRYIDIRFSVFLNPKIFIFVLQIFLFARNSINFLLWSGEGSQELRNIKFLVVTKKRKYHLVKNQDVTSLITTAYHRMVYSYAEDKSIFSHDIIDLTKAVRMTSCVWQFYRKYLGSRRTDFRTLILDLTYRNQDLGETILGRNAVIRINIKRHFGYLHLLSTFIHELAHFLENRFCEVDHGNTFYSLGMTLINILQCSNLDLTEYGISQTDIAKLEISIM